MRDADVRVTFEDSTGARARRRSRFVATRPSEARWCAAPRRRETGHATRLARVDDEDETTRPRVSRAYDRVTVDVRGATFARDIVHRYLDSGIRESDARDNWDARRGGRGGASAIR